MVQRKRTAGIELTLPDDVDVEEISGAAPLRRRAPQATVPRANDDEIAGLVEALDGEDVVVLDAFALTAAPAVPGRRRAPGAQGAPAKLSVELDGDEQAVLLVEQDGCFTWQFASTEEAGAPSAVRRRSTAPAPKRLVFDLAPPVPSSPASRGRRSRGPVTDFLAGRVRTWVFKWIARKAVGGAVRVLERNVQPGLVVLSDKHPDRWKRLDALDAARLPTDRPARILLFVHGTFSSTCGSFGALCASDWGRSFLREATAAYDIVLGYDHPTLSESPLENANDLLRRIQPALSTNGARIDAIAYSRGALVLRSLIEYLLPATRLRVRVGRAVFVGGTNGGTELAEPDNWKRLIDLYTNLSAVAARGLKMLSAPVAAIVFRESVATLGALVRYLAEEAVHGDAAPGLAAMEPDGPFVRDINGVQPGQPIAADAFYHVIRSEFDVALLARGDAITEFPRRLAAWIVDSFADQLMREPNDLVVNVRSMDKIDPDAGGFVRDRFDFPKNSHVYHTVYFTRPEVVAALSRWLEIPGLPESVGGSGERPRSIPGPAGRAMPAAAETNLLVVDAESPATEVAARISEESPAFVAVDRDRGSYWYAFTRDEVARIVAASPGGSLEDALGGDARLRLGEDGVSRRRDIDSAAISAGGWRNTAVTDRTILFSGDLPVGVVAGSADIAPHAELLVAGRRSIVGKRGARSADDAARDERPGIDRTVRSRRQGPGADTAASKPIVVPPVVAPPVSSLAPPDEGTCFVGATTSTPIGKDEVVPLSVTLSREELMVRAGNASGVASGSIDYSRQVVVQVVAIRNVEVVGDDRIVLEPSAIAPRAFIEFQIRGTATGDGEVWVILRQGPASVATVALKPEISSRPAKAKRRVDATTEGAMTHTGGEPYPLLQIFETMNGSELRYLFVLTLADGTPVQAMSDPVKSDRAAYVDAIYKEIEQRWIASARDAKQFEQEIREYGAQLLDELVPDAIVKRLWDVRDSLRAIHVVSAEPFIPWEIVHLKEPRAVGGPPAGLPADSHFLAQKGLVRWLHNYDLTSRLRVRPGKAWYTIPNYPYANWELPAAQAEIPFLVDTFGAQPVPSDGAAAPHGNVLRALFRRRGDVDLFHFSGHGSADGTGALRSRIWLLGPAKDANGNDAGEPFASTAIEAIGSLVGTDGTRPIAFLNACQVGSLGWNLTSIGGFAKAFLQVGAGAFVGALWSVGDQPAATFGKEFYQALVDGRRLSEAAVIGRDRARTAGEGTWLAYVVYGHPHATLEVGPRPG